MKTQVIHLDAHDDLVSVRDRMSWAKTERILLVFPSDKKNLSRLLDLHLLNRHAASLGAQLGIVSRVEDFRLAAQELGIPAFATVMASRNQEWQPRQHQTLPAREGQTPDLKELKRAAYPPEPGWRAIPALKPFFFSLAVLAILVISSLFIPSAQIKLVPDTRVQTLELPISAGLQVNSINVAGSLPSRIAMLVIEKSRTVPTTGSTVIPDAKASGVIRFRNLTTSAITIPAGTQVSSVDDPGIVFATLTEASLPAEYGNTVHVDVQAREGGPAGNLPADSLVAIQGVLGASLSATNPSSTSGGSEISAPIQTSSDRVEVREALLQGILADCKISLLQNRDTADLFFPDTLSASQVLSETYFPAEDQSSENLSLTMRVQCQEQYASREDILTLVRLVMDANPSEGYIPLPGGIQVGQLEQPATDGEGISHWQVTATRDLQARLEPLKIIQLVLGKTVHNAEKALITSLPINAPPQVTIHPGWWRWLPLLPFRITVEAGNG